MAHSLAASISEASRRLEFMTVRWNRFRGTEGRGVTATTTNRSLEVVRTILNRAARSYRDDDGRWRPRKTKELIALAIGVAVYMGGGGPSLMQATRVDSVAELEAPVAHEVLSGEAYAIGSGRTRIEPHARHRSHPAENRRILCSARSSDNLRRCARRTSR